MARAKSVSKYSTHPNYKVGCVITNGGRVLSCGFNKNKTHPYVFRHSRGRTLHAEIDALIKLRSENPDEIYVYRERSDGTPGNSRPCPMCLAAIIESGIRRMYYTIDGGYSAEEI